MEQRRSKMFLWIALACIVCLFVSVTEMRRLSKDRNYIDRIYALQLVGKSESDCKVLLESIGESMHFSGRSSDKANEKLYENYPDKPSWGIIPLGVSRLRTEFTFEKGRMKAVSTERIGEWF
jgi:hypothetical protein